MTWLKNLSAKQCVSILFAAGLAIVVLAVTNTSYPAELILAGFFLMLPAPTLGLLHAANHNRKATR